MTLFKTQYNVQPVNEMVSHDTRVLLLVLITWGKQLHLSNKRFIAVYGFCIKICDNKSDKFQKMFMRVRRYKRFITYIFDKLFCYESILNDVLMKTSHIENILNKLASFKKGIQYVGWQLF